MYASWNNSSASQVTLTSSAAVIPNQWQHFVHTFSVSGTSVTVTQYVDGVQIGTITSAAGYSGTYGTTLYLGTLTSSTDNFNGEIGQVTFYNTTLTAAQVLSRYQGTKASVVAPGSVVSQWLMTEGAGTTVTDSLGNSNFSLQNSPNWDYGYYPFDFVQSSLSNSPNPVYANSLSFNGSSQYGSTVTPSVWNIQTKTFEFWIKCAVAPSGRECLFSMGGANYYIAVTTSNELQLSYVDGSSTQQNPTSVTCLSIGQWQHVVFTFSISGSNVTTSMYCNGVSVYSNTLGTGMSSSYGATSYIGSFNTTTSFFQGQIAEMTIYNVALTQSQVLQRYGNASPFVVAPNSVVSQFTFSEGSGSYLLDTLGSAIFTLTASPTWISYDYPLGQVNTNNIYQNLLTYSNSFTSSSWTATHLSLLSGQADIYNGQTSWALVEDGTTNQRQIGQTWTISATSSFTLSVYAKAGSRNYLWLSLDTGTNVSSFNLGTGALGTISANHTAKIVPSNNGYYLCSVIQTLSSAGGSAYIGCEAVSGTVSYLGTSGITAIYICNAQLSKTNYVAQYVPTLALPVNTGTLPNAIPQAQQNLITYSNAFNNAIWTTNQCSIGTGVTDPYGGSTAYSLIDNGTTNNHYINLTSSITVSGATNTTFSVFAQAAGINFILLQLASGIAACFNLTNGTYITNTASGQVIARAIALSGSWYRLSVTTPYITSAACSIYASNISTLAPSYLGNSTAAVYLYGAQLSQTAGVIEYIATSGTAVQQASTPRLLS
jgi:hypothetical protein